MAFVKQVLLDDHKRYVIKVHGDVAEVSTLLCDVSALAKPCTKLALESIDYDVLPTVAVELLWDATADVRIVKMNGSAHSRCWEKFGGLPNNAGAGVTGDVNMVVTGTGSYDFVASFKKLGVNSAS